MRMTDETPHTNISTYAKGLALGALAALLICLLVLTAASLAVVNGLLSQDSAGLMTIIACLTGSFFGGLLAIRKIKSRALIVGALTGAVLFILLILLGFLIYFYVAPQNGVGILLASLAGGSLAGLISASTRKKRRT